MFCDCVTLIAAHGLPATTLANYCYYSIFQGCSNLNYINCLATDISATSITSNWAYGVSSMVTFAKNSDMADWEIDSVDGIPSEWTVQTI